MEGVMGFWPSDAVGWTTFGANIATIVGAVSISLILSINLSAVVRFQRRTVLVRELTALSAETGIPMSTVQRDLLNTVLHWAENSTFAQGVASVTPEYREYVARLLSLFELILMDTQRANQPETLAKLKELLARHATALRRLPISANLVPISKKLRELVEEAMTP